MIAESEGGIEKGAAPPAGVRRSTYKAALGYLPLPVLRERAGVRVSARTLKALTLTLSRITGRGDQSPSRLVLCPADVIQRDLPRTRRNEEDRQPVSLADRDG